MSIKFSFTMPDADVLKAIASLNTRGKTYQNNVHQVAVSVLAAWVKHGDAPTASARMTALFNAVPGYYHKALGDWLSARVGMTYADDVWTATKTTITQKEAVAAKDEPFWEFSPPQKYKPVVLPELLASVIKRADKRRKDGIKTNEGDMVPQDLLDDLHAIANKHGVKVA